MFGVVTCIIKAEKTSTRPLAFYHLVISDPSYRDRVPDTLHEPESSVLEDLKTQFRTLIEDQLLQAQHLVHRPAAFVVDALDDECEQDKGVSHYLATIIRLAP